MNNMFSIDSIVATRRPSFLATFRGQTSTAKFIGPLRGLRHANAFEASFSDTASATAEHVAATAGTSSKIRQGMVIVRCSPPARGGVAAFRGQGGGSDGIVKNKYANNPGKLDAWISACHVEKAAKKKEPPTP